MSDTTTGTESTESTSSAVAQEGAEGAPNTDESNDQESTDTKAEEPTSVDQLPHWAQKELTKARNEAARYRTQAKEASDNAKAEASGDFATRLQSITDEKATAVADLENTRTDNLRLRAALNAGIPGESAVEFAELLKGSSEEEINAHAEKVKTLFGVSRTSPATDPRQGADGDYKPEVKPGLGRLQYAYSSNNRG